MAAFCIIQNFKSRETFMWVGRNVEEGKWFESGPEEFKGMNDFVKVLESSDDPELLLKEIGSLWGNDK